MTISSTNFSSFILKAVITLVVGGKCVPVTRAQNSVVPRFFGEFRNRKIDLLDPLPPAFFPLLVT